MDSKEVLSLVKNLEKNRANDTAVLEILRALEKDVIPTEKLLRETKVGVEVNKFKRSGNAEIAKLVKRIISAWKDAINKHKLKQRELHHQQHQLKQGGTSQSNAGHDGASAAATTTTTTTTSASTGGVSGSTASKDSHSNNSSNNNNNPSGVAGARLTHTPQFTKPRNAKNDGVNTTIYNHKLRDSVIKALYDALAKESNHPPSAILQICIEIENEMNKLNNVAHHARQYKEKYRVVYSNIISRNNPELKFKIVNGDLTPHYLVTCDPKELAPEKLKKELEEIREKNLFNAQGATIERSVTDRFTCGKCKEKKVSYYQLQTRSADEPLTTFCTCEVCGNRWKFS